MAEMFGPQTLSPITSRDEDAIIAKIEDARTRDVIDTLAGGVLRLFARLNRLERRLTLLEAREAARPRERSEKSREVPDPDLVQTTLGNGQTCQQAASPFREAAIVVSEPG
jgi:hypothetical protein